MVILEKMFIVCTLATPQGLLKQNLTAKRVPRDDNMVKCHGQRALTLRHAWHLEDSKY